MWASPFSEVLAETVAGGGEALFFSSAATSKLSCLVTKTQTNSPSRKQP